MASASVAYHSEAFAREAEQFEGTASLVQLAVQTLTGMIVVPETTFSALAQVVAVKEEVHAVSGIPVRHQSLVWQSSVVENSALIGGLSLPTEGAVLQLLVQLPPEEQIADARRAMVEAVAALDVLCAKDFNELKKLAKPPAGVDCILESVLHLRAGIDSTIAVDSKGRVKDCSWKASQKMMKDPKHFLAGLRAFKKMIEDAKEQNEKLPETKRSVKWEFQTSPHEQFGKTLDDLYMSFLKWARKNKKSKEDKKKKSDEAETETTTKKEKILNVNKAFRRLESYADWMDSSKEDLKDPLTYESIKDALVPWGMESSIGKENHFVWWIDFKKIDKKAVKENPIIDSFRSFVWYSHFVMYNSNAQDYGMMIVENCEGLGFIEMMTLFPMKLGTKLDRLTMGVLPVKMEKCYITETPTWMKLFMKFMKVFMSKKLRDRIVLVQEWDDLTTSLGEECIPKGFGKLKGNENFKDLLEQKQESK